MKPLNITYRGRVYTVTTEPELLLLLSAMTLSDKQQKAAA